MEQKKQYRDKARETTYPVAEQTTLLPFLLTAAKGKGRYNKSSMNRTIIRARRQKCKENHYASCNLHPRVQGQSI